MYKFSAAISRRTLLALFGRSALFSSALALIPRLASGNAGNGDKRSEQDHQLDLLAGMIKELYPHEALAQEFYREIAHAIRDRAQTSPETRSALRTGMARLAALSGADRRVPPAVVPELEDEAFFQFIKTAAAEEIYRHPRVWELIGYGGNALARGGYLNQGFNDIGWLPAGKP